MDLIAFEDIDPPAERAPPVVSIEDKLYVAVGKEAKECESILLWAVKNSGGRKIYIIHVHQPAEFIPILGEKIHWSKLTEHRVNAYREFEKRFMMKTLDEYIHFCGRFGAKVEKLYIEMDSVGKGILYLISHHKIENLVMGAAKDEHFDMKMVESLSQTAICVQSSAPASCHIWFICKGKLICSIDGGLQASSNGDNRPSFLSRPLLMHGQSSRPKADVPGQESYCRERSSDLARSNGGNSEFYCGNVIEDVFTSQIQPDQAGSSKGLSKMLKPSASQRSDLSVSSHELSVNSASVPLETLAEESNGHEHYEQLDWSLVTVENKTQEAHEESPKCQIAEMTAICRAKAAESLYVQELKKRTETEVALEKMKNQNNTVMEELQVALDQNLSLEVKITEYEVMVNDLRERMQSSTELLQISEKEHNDLRIEHDNVLKVAEELLNLPAESSSVADTSKLFPVFSFTEIKEATQDFSPELQLWEEDDDDDDGSIYKGVLSCTKVTIRMLRPDGLQVCSKFLKEVEVLSKFRHPNVVTLIGACPDACSIIYEYLPNGSLEDRLSCKDGTPPLTWKSRIKIATELCSALSFLHSCKPQGVVHGGLTPKCVLIDPNFTCKLSNFGFSCIIPCTNVSSSTASVHICSYTDPEFLDSGEVSPKLDVYSFGIILLRLLTGDLVFDLIGQVESALVNNCLESLLDSSAGGWPCLLAGQLARVALRCCESESTNRPDLESDVFRVLEPMLLCLGGDLSERNLDDAPSYFICPILQEVMKDPHIAADGHTYEAEALRSWLGSGHDTSPMTNARLEHENLVPNHALRSAIHEWLQQH